MRHILSLSFSLSVVLLAGTVARSQAIIAGNLGIPEPARVIDFGANLLPNFAPVTTQFPGLTVTNASYFTINGSSNGLVGGFLTKDLSSASSLLRLQFGAPVSDTSFVYHQVGTLAPSTIRSLLAGVVVDSFSGTWTQFQTNNVFGFTNSSFDEIQIDFVSDFNIDQLAFNPADAALCTPYNGTGVNLAGFLCSTLPVLGTTWQGQIVTASNTLLTALVYAPLGLGPPVPLFAGELLLQPSAGDVLFASSGSYALPVPAASSWLGTTLTFQGVRLDNLGGVATIVPMNARRLRLGL
jgi:hypothetical protein